MTRLQVTIVVSFGLSVVFIVWGKNTQADNFFDNPAKSVTRDSIAPVYSDELDRKMTALKLRLAQRSAVEPTGRESKEEKRARWEDDKAHLHERVHQLEHLLAQKKKELEIVKEQIVPLEMGPADSSWLASLAEKAVQQ